MTVSYATAFIGGLLTILAPCASMLLPAFFAYAFASRTTMASRTLVFVLGLMAALIPLGAAAGSVGQLLSTYRYEVGVVSGVVIIVLGVILALSLPFPHLRLPSSMGGRGAGDGATVPAVFLLGVSYGLAGAGCTGPILGTVLFVAGQTGSVGHGAIVMGLYALGMATPVVVFAFLWDALDIGSRGFLRPKPVKVFGRYTTVGSLISGVIFIILGVLLASGIDFGNLLAISPTMQANLEDGAMKAFNALPNWLFVVLLLGLIALVAYGFVVLRRKHARKMRSTDGVAAGGDAGAGGAAGGDAGAAGGDGVAAGAAAGDDGKSDGKTGAKGR